MPRRIKRVKRELIVFAIVSCALGVLLVFWVRQPVISPHEVPEQRTEIDLLIKTLRKETLEQSIENLITNHNQYALGASDPMGQQVLEEMLSSRRAIKVLDDLRQMPEVKRIGKCKQIFERAMQVNKEVHDNAFRKAEQPGFTAPMRPIPVHGIAVAMFATAETGRREIVAEQIGKLEEFRSYLEARMMTHRTLYSDARFLATLRFCRPDSRFQVNVIRLAALSDARRGSSQIEEVDRYLKSVGMTTVEVLIVPWNARTTSFEFRVGSAPDTSRGSTTYMFYNWGGEPMFRNGEEEERVLQELKRIAFESEF